MVFLCCWWEVRRFGAFCRWTLRRKSNLTACWDILSWNWSNSWQRLERLRVLWLSWIVNRYMQLPRTMIKNKTKKRGLFYSEPTPGLLPLCVQHGLDTSTFQQVKLWVEDQDSPCGREGDNNHTGSEEPTCNSCEMKYMVISTKQMEDIHLPLSRYVKTNLLQEKQTLTGSGTKPFGSSSCWGLLNGLPRSSSFLLRLLLPEKYFKRYIFKKKYTLKVHFHISTEAKHVRGSKYLTHSLRTSHIDCSASNVWIEQ